jgi:hypothetical protein
MGSNNGIETIRHPAKHSRLIPVLIDSTSEKANGFVPSRVWGDKPVTMVQCLLPSFLKNLRNPQRLKEIEKIHGSISSAEWTRLRRMHSLIDRLNSGDWSPILSPTSSQIEELLLISGECQVLQPVQSRFCLIWRFDSSVARSIHWSTSNFIRS